MLWLKANLPSRKLIVYRAMMLSLVTLFVLFVFQPFDTINDTSSLLQLCCAVYLRRWLCVNQSLIEERI